MELKNQKNNCSIIDFIFQDEEKRALNQAAIVRIP
jgi:hypothetical protein